MLRSHARAPARRPAAVLLVVITLLTLFAIVGLAFVLYAESQATSSRIWREANQPTVSIDYEELINFALGDIVYDAPDDDRGVGSGVRGHGLARPMYGWNPPGATNTNTVPFSGTGRLRGLPAYQGLNEIDAINYTYFPGAPIRDPEFTGTRNLPTDAKTGQYTGGANAPYTYPDINNLALAATDGNGNVVKPSFHAPWIFNPSHGLNDGTNPEWTNATGRYKLIRPRPQEMGPGFPMPVDNVGDVKNIAGAPGGSDAIWISQNHPPITLADGRQVAPLYAWTILPLDNRVNVNVVGNYLSGAHSSNQGWGRWEANPTKALTDGASTLAFNQVLQGRAGPPVIVGRHNTSLTPTTAAPANIFGTTTQPFRFSQIDFDAVGGASAVTATTGSFEPFPSFPAQFGNLQGTERNNHPSQYNPYWTARYGGKAYSTAEMVYLMGNRGTPGGVQPEVTQQSNSELYQVLARFNTGTDGNARLMNRITTISNDLDRAGVAPYIFNRTASPYRLANTNAPVGTGNFPQGTVAAFPNPQTDRGNSTADGEFDAQWRSKLAALGRVDINRKLATYPTVDSATGMMTDANQAGRATADRQGLVKEVFDRLRLVTGAKDLSGYKATPPAAPPTPADSDFEGLRFLAQLAVNLVDYVDEDEIMTPFNFLADLDYTATPPRYSTTPASGWVYGVERPRLLLNEAFAHISNDPESSQKEKEGDPTMADGNLEFPKPSAKYDPDKPPTAFKDSHYLLNFWVELHNPTTATTANSSRAPVDGGNARLWVTDSGSGTKYNPYQIVVRNGWLDTATKTQHGDYVRRPWNSEGDLEAAPKADPAGSVLTESIDLLVSEFEPDPNAPPDYPTGLTPNPKEADSLKKDIVPPANGQYAGTANDATNGFLVVGPKHRMPTNWDMAAKPPVPFAPPFSPSLRLEEKPSQQGTQQSALSYRFKVDDVTAYRMAKSNMSWDEFLAEIHPFFVLRRLTNPHLRPNDPAITTGPHAYDANRPFNPYVTVDLMELPRKTLILNDDVHYNPKVRDDDINPGKGRQAPPPLPDTFVSRGKFAPMDSRDASAQNSNPTSPVANAPKTTFFRHNGDADTATNGDGTYLKRDFDWVPHLDRPAVSRFELLGVSALRNHDMTQAYYTGSAPTPTANQHLAPWFDPNSRLARALELIGTRDLTVGTPFGGRVAGKVNINNVQETAILRAICDANANSTTLNSDTAVDNLFTNMKNARTPDAGSRIGAGDHPFWGMGAPTAPDGAATTQYGSQFQVATSLPTGSWLRDQATPGTQTMFLANKTTPQPPFGNEVLSKLDTQLTPRSNVFAVWCTIGVFNVTDASVRPMRLGAEDTSLRRRFFCIVDRTNLAIKDPNSATDRIKQSDNKPVWLRFRPTTANDDTQPGLVQPGAVTINVSEATTGTGTTSVGGTYDGTPWTIRAGTRLYIDQAQNQTGADATLNRYEQVTVSSVNYTGPGNATITFTTTRPHAVDCPICTEQIGNPGPQGTINYQTSPWRDTVLPFAMWLP